MLCGYIWVYFLNNVFRDFMQEGFQHIDKTVISPQLQHTLESNTRDVRGAVVSLVEVNYYQCMREVSIMETISGQEGALRPSC